MEHLLTLRLIQMPAKSLTMLNRQKRTTAGLTVVLSSIVKHFLLLLLLLYLTHLSLIRIIIKTSLNLWLLSRLASLNRRGGQLSTNKVLQIILAITLMFFSSILQLHHQ